MHPWKTPDSQQKGELLTWTQGLLFAELRSQWLGRGRQWLGAVSSLSGGLGSTPRSLVCQLCDPGEVHFLLCEWGWAWTLTKLWQGLNEVMPIKLLGRCLAHGNLSAVHHYVIITLHVTDDVRGLTLLSPQNFCRKKKARTSSHFWRTLIDVRGSWSTFPKSDSCQKWCWNFFRFMEKL